MLDNESYYLVFVGCESYRNVFVLFHEIFHFTKKGDRTNAVLSPLEIYS